MDNRLQSGLYSQRRELKGKKVSFGMSAPKVLQKNPVKILEALLLKFLPILIKHSCFCYLRFLKLLSKKKKKDSTVKATFKTIARNFQILLSALPLEAIMGWIIGLATFFFIFYKIKDKNSKEYSERNPII